MAPDKEAQKQLSSFMAKYDDEIAERAELILAEMRKLYPTSLELVYDNYNALAIGFAPTERASDAIFSIALFPRWVSLFFLQASGLPDPDKILKGSGNVARHVVLPTPDALYEPSVAALMREAAARAKVPFDPRGAHRLVIKSVSAKQRPRRPAQATTAGAAPGGTPLKKKTGSRK
jgi:hypothetical protein